MLRRRFLNTVLKAGAALCLPAPSVAGLLGDETRGSWSKVLEDGHYYGAAHFDARAVITRKMLEKAALNLLMYGQTTIHYTKRTVYAVLPPFRMKKG